LDARKGVNMFKKVNVPVCEKVPVNSPSKKKETKKKRMDKKVIYGIYPLSPKIFS